LDNIAILFGTVFRNAANLPILWLLEGCGLLIGIGLTILQARKTHSNAIP
jgi:formate-dependent nitrite reductase membrane component NrfD